MGRRSALSTHNKPVQYKHILKPMSTYGIQLWGCTKPSNITTIQRFPNKVLRNIVNAPWYVPNTGLHRHLKMEKVTAEIRWFARKNEERLLEDNVEAIQLLDSRELQRRLKMIKPFELVSSVAYRRGGDLGGSNLPPPKSEGPPKIVPNSTRL